LDKRRILGLDQQEPWCFISDPPSRADLPRDHLRQARLVRLSLANLFLLL